MCSSVVELTDELLVQNHVMELVLRADIPFEHQTVFEMCALC